MTLFEKPVNLRLMSTESGERPGYPSGRLTPSEDRRKRLPEEDESMSDFNKTYALFGIGEHITGEIEGEGGSDRSESRMVLKDGTEVRIATVLGEGEMCSVKVSKGGSEIVGFSLNPDGLYAIHTDEQYLSRTMFLHTWVEDSEIDDDFRSLSTEMVKWLGVSIFSGELQPFPEEVTSRVKEIASVIG